MNIVEEENYHINTKKTCLKKLRCKDCNKIIYHRCISKNE